MYNEPAAAGNNFSITSPKENWSYSTERKILLTVNCDTQSVVWTSSVDGLLGKGNGLLVYLSAGRHTVTASYNGTQKTTVVTVTAGTESPENCITRLITAFPCTIKYGAGRYIPYFVSGEAEVQDLSVKTSGVASLNLRNACSDPVCCRDAAVRRLPENYVFVSDKKTMQEVPERLLTELFML